MDKTYKIDLTLNEMLLIDGKVSEEAQKVINLAKHEFAHGFDDFPIMNEILRKSEDIGSLSWSYKAIRYCNFCDKKVDYHTYPRNSRYHRKGDKNHNKPKYYSGIKFNEGFVTISGYGDMCTECCNKHNVIERLVKAIIEKDLKIEIKSKSYVSKYLRDPIQICYNCNEEMRESEMKPESTLMGDGYYPSGCPHCGAESLLFGSSHKFTNNFVFAHNPEYCDEVFAVKEILEQYNNSVNNDLRIHFKQAKNDKNKFSIKETRFTNGYRDVISFDVKNKYFIIGLFYRDNCPFKDILLNAGYTDKTEYK